MRDTPRGSYAAHQLVSRYDSGPTAGHTLDGWHRRERPVAAILIACVIFAAFAGWMLSRGGVVDHNRYEVTRVR